MVAEVLVEVGADVCLVKAVADVVMSLLELDLLFSPLGLIAVKELVVLVKNTSLFYQLMIVVPRAA